MKKATQPTKVFLVLTTAILAGCSTVTSSAEEISIRHSANNDLQIAATAERHCREFGKTARLVQRTPKSNEYFVETVVSTYACIDPN